MDGKHHECSPKASPEKIVALRKEAVENHFLAELAPMLSACGNPARFLLLYVIWKEGEICVCDLADVLGVTQPAVSRHLKILRELGLVDTRRDAQSILCRLKSDSGFAILINQAFTTLGQAG